MLNDEQKALLESQSFGMSDAANAVPPPVIHQPTGTVSIESNVDDGENQAVNLSEELETKRNEKKTMGSGLCRRGTNKNESSQLVHELLEHQTKLEREKETLKKKVHALEEELDNYKKRDGELTQQMAVNLITKSKGIYEAITDVSNPSSIKQTLVVLYNDTWSEVMETVFSEDEKAGLNYLCRVIRNCQAFCEETAATQLDILLYPKLTLMSHQRSPDVGKNEHISHILLDDEDGERQHIDVDEILEERERRELFRIRRISAVSSKTQSCMRKLFRREVATDRESQELFEKVPEGGQNLLQQYWDSCVQICWMIVITDPPVKLKFCEENDPYDKVKDMFHAYSTQEVIRLENKRKNTVFSTVLPAMVSLDENTVYLKGQVLITSHDGWNDTED